MAATTTTAPPCGLCGSLRVDPPDANGFRECHECGTWAHIHTVVPDDH